MTEEWSRKFYGRKQGHKLHSHPAFLVDTLLPKLAISLDQAKAFDIFPDLRDDQMTTLEIGFGGGEHLAHRASEARDHAFLGCEVFLNGVAELLGAVENENIENIKIHHGDARDLLEVLPEASFDQIYLLYPDPWPKKRHNKRRFISQENLDSLHRVLKLGGNFMFASDIADYINWTLAHIKTHGGFEWSANRAEDWIKAPKTWPGTRYEQKAIAAGRTPTYLSFLRR